MQDVEVAAPASVAPVLRIQAEENVDAALIDIPTPSPEARVFLRTFASSMAARPAEIRADTWSAALLVVTNRLGRLRLHDPRLRGDESALKSPATGTGVQHVVVMGLCDEDDFDLGSYPSLASFPFDPLVFFFFLRFPFDRLFFLKNILLY